MKDDKKRRNAVARVMAAENKSEAIAAEAKRLGVASRTIERWVEAAKGPDPVRRDVVSGNDAPPEKTPKDTVLDKLLDKDPAKEKPADGPITKGEIAQGAADAEKFCVEAYAGVRAAVGAVMVSWKFAPPLDATSPEVLKVLEMTKAAELAIRANAPRLYPILTRYASNWGALVLAIGADAFGMILGLESLARSKGWAPVPKKREDRPAQVQVPSPADYGEQLRAAAADAPPRDPKTAIVDAPIPTPEQVDQVNMVRQALMS